MTVQVVVQPPGHTVIVEHETITTMVLSGPSSVTVVEVPGPQGPPGKKGDGGSEPDLPDLSLLFENGLV